MRKFVSTFHQGIVPMMSMNSAYVDEMYFEYLRNPESVSPEWRVFFANYVPEVPLGNGSKPSAPSSTSGTPLVESKSVPVAESRPVAPAASPAVSDTGTRMPALHEGDEIVALSSIASIIAENMERSLTVPTATSVRNVPVKALEENRTLINEFRLRSNTSKLSFTHILAWAIVKAVERTPAMNSTFGLNNGIPVRIKRAAVNLGLAVDVTRRDGSRVLLVPSIKNAQNMNFAQFADAYDEIIQKARTNKLTPDDLAGATISLTNPGMIGTVMSMPRLMEGQGTIIATGSIEYPAEFQAVLPDVLHTLAISKVVTLSSTYDHRVIQGAESGEFLQTIHRLLIGEDRFYDQIFAALAIPFEPMRWKIEQGGNPFLTNQDQPEVIDKEGRVVQLIHSYRVRGYLLADINPLGLESYYYPKLDPAHYGFTIWDLDREFDTGGLGGIKRATLRDIFAMLREVYCGQIGTEWMHIENPEKRDWIQNYLESRSLLTPLSSEKKLDTYKKLVRADQLESFLHTKFLGAKRFSLEGGESTMIILDEMLECAANASLNGAVLGMAHRGRLNVLVNMMGKPLETLFNEFEDVRDPETSFQGSGDVKYHLGARGTYQSSNGATLPIFLAPNPSHLEAVNPVVEGIARALTDEIGDETQTSVLPILIHGDAAFSGQGVVAETLNMARLPGYRTGGTLHIIINNQIGFTAAPEDSRSTPYATGIAKMLMVPILHVNGNNPEACRAAAAFAFAYREQFEDDVVIDMYCYRKYGHNEQDDPTATQPLLYKKIRNMQPVQELFGKRLLADHTAKPEILDNIKKEEHQRLDNAFNNRHTTATSPGGNVQYDLFAPVNTRVEAAVLQELADAICAIQPGFDIHSKVKHEVERRHEQFTAGTVQWGMAEALAFGSIIRDGRAVRLSGQDSGRGTFNHRQAVQHDMVSDRRIVPINRLSQGIKRLHIYDSSLSEYAILGFEYGYSTIAKTDLTIWEAQFGDFANGAQIVIDQFISSAEEKWGQRSNLTLLLPHGYDGQGPEHSSARLERFLQLCAQNNMIVGYYTTPANYFHALRRQVLADWRKPLVVMTPKGYLRLLSSSVTDLSEGLYQEIIDDSTIQNPDLVQRVVLSAGKVYFELAKKREATGQTNSVALIRIEQLYPLNTEKLRATLSKYPAAQSVVWCQEEPENMGSWSFIEPYLKNLLRINQTLHYAGRTAAASPATGSAKQHNAEQEQLLNRAFAVFE